MNDIMKPETDQEKHLVQILLAKLRGMPIEAKCKLDLYPQWKSTDDTYLKLGGSTEYRIKPKEPLKLHNEVWKCIPSKWKYIAQDKNGLTHVYAREPFKDYASSQWCVSSGNRKDYKRITEFHIDMKGYNWDETLIKRPENI